MKIVYLILLLLVTFAAGYGFRSATVNEVTYKQYFPLFSSQASEKVSSVEALRPSCTYFNVHRPCFCMGGCRTNCSCSTIVA